MFEELENEKKRTDEFMKKTKILEKKLQENIQSENYENKIKELQLQLMEVEEREK